MCQDVYTVPDCIPIRDVYVKVWTNCINFPSFMNIHDNYKWKSLDSKTFRCPSSGMMVYIRSCMLVETITSKSFKEESPSRTEMLTIRSFSNWLRSIATFSLMKNQLNKSENQILLIPVAAVWSAVLNAWTWYYLFNIVLFINLLNT